MNTVETGTSVLIDELKKILNSGHSADNKALCISPELWEKVKNDEAVLQWLDSNERWADLYFDHSRWTEKFNHYEIRDIALDREGTFEHYFSFREDPGSGKIALEKALKKADDMEKRLLVARAADGYLKIKAIIAFLEMADEPEHYLYIFNLNFPDEYDRRVEKETDLIVLTIERGVQVSSFFADIIAFYSAVTKLGNSASSSLIEKLKFRVINEALKTNIEFAFKDVIIAFGRLYDFDDERRKDAVISLFETSIKIEKSRRLVFSLPAEDSAKIELKEFFRDNAPSKK